MNFPHSFDFFRKKDHYLNCIAQESCCCCRGKLEKFLLLRAETKPETAAFSGFCARARHINFSSIRIPDSASILPLHTLLWSPLNSIFSPHQFKLHVLLVFPTHYVDIVPTDFCGTITCTDRLFHTTAGHCDLALLPVLDSLMRSLLLGWARQLMFSIFIVLSGVRCAHAKPCGHNSNAFWAILHTHIALHTVFVAPYDPTEATSSSAHKCFLSTSDGLPGGSFIHALAQYERIYGAMFPFWKARPT